jgi:hypothetical protein
MEWRFIQHYDDFYQVSTTGIVKNKYGKIISIHYINGYSRIGLNKKGVRKLYLLHRIVAETFIPNPNNLKFVNHKNCNKQDNSVENLEWCNHAYNIAHASKNKCWTTSRGKNISETNNEIVLGIKVDLLNGLTLKQIAAKYEINYQRVLYLKKTYT